MDIISSIENALKSINEAKFQKLINHILRQKGYTFILSPGSVVGKEKTRKGSPDSFFKNDEGYVFVECTTKEKLGNSKSLFNKLSKDIDHCFAEDVTKIENSKINTVVLACNEIISPEEYNLLNKQIKDINPNAEFEFLNIQNLSTIIVDHPTLASTYLNIELLKGEIFDLDQFLEKSKNTLQPSLINTFIGREEQLLESVNYLEEGDKLLLTGGAGVGKSKLAVEIMKTFVKKGFVPLVIQSSAVPLWDDLNKIFKDNTDYIVLVDDANKSINNFNYLLTHTNHDKKYQLKIIVTSRDYVKQKVSESLNDFNYREINVPTFKDAEIEKIIVTALPNLQNYFDLKKLIVELAKGNARLALMATSSAKPGSKNNYLNNVALLYDEYFRKVSAEVKIFSNPSNLKALAIISFFGTVDRNNYILKDELQKHFKIDWNEFWSSIIELHNNELIDVYQSEMAKISDQVLGMYSFYKFFIDNKSAEIDYSHWIIAFIKNYSPRINSTLVEVNNTFGYNHIKKFITPHLKFIFSECSEEDEYTFIKIFWLYDQKKCLLFIKKWIQSLPNEILEKPYQVHYEHNDHTVASKYFELIFYFWNSINPYFETSIELLLDLNLKQPKRYPETLKFVKDYFSYRVSDVYANYERQQLFLNILSKFGLQNKYKLISRGIVLSMTKNWLEWHHSDYSNSKGKAFTITNFHLHKTDELLKFRAEILNYFSDNFNKNEKIFTDILNAINHSRGMSDKSIYIAELPIYDSLIAKKLNTSQYLHCKFVKNLSKIVAESGGDIPIEWADFIDSEVMKLSHFLRPDWENNPGISISESDRLKKENFEKFIADKSWNEIEKFLFAVDNLSNQQLDNTFWFIDNAITQIFNLIAKKNKQDFINAINLFFSGKIKFSLTTQIISAPIYNGIMTGKEFLEIINLHNFIGKLFWESAVLTYLPKIEIDLQILLRLFEVFKDETGNLHLAHMQEYVKYEDEFNKLKLDDNNLIAHNIITYLTKIIITKKSQFRNDLGLHFFSECSSFFTNQKSLFGLAYWRTFSFDPHFDYEGKELSSVLEINDRFLIESIKAKQIGFGYSTKYDFKDIHCFVLWNLDNYKKVIKELFFFALDSSPHYYSYEDAISALFTGGGKIDNKAKKIKFIDDLLLNHSQNNKLVIVLISVVYDNFRDWLVSFLKEVLTLNKDFLIFKEMSLGNSESWTGSKVPLIQTKINLYENILSMIYQLPDILDYFEHIEYIEQKIQWKKEEIELELKRDFIEEFY